MIYRSWAEDFGLPVVEALATGVPFISSTATALREVGGKFASYVDSEDLEGVGGSYPRFRKRSIESNFHLIVLTGQGNLHGITRHLWFTTHPES